MVIKDDTSVIHVCALVDGWWHIFNLDLESTLDSLHNVVIFLAWNERDGKTLGSESSCSTNSVEILVWLMWHVKINDDVDFFNINTSCEQVCCNQNSKFDLFELIINGISLFLWEISVACFSWESFFFDDLTKFFGILLLTCENNNLIELKAIKKINKFHDLLLFFKLNVILFETMQSEFFLFVDEKLIWVLHVHRTHLLWFLRECSTEHQNLSVLSFAAHKNLLNLPSHVWFNQHFVAFIKDEIFKIVQIKRFLSSELKNSTWGSDDDVWWLITFQNSNVVANWNTTIEDFRSDFWQMLGESVHFFFDLVCQLSGITHD